ncbi:TolC family protein [Sphingomonas kyeonggiensis]|uniref:Outer membrane protein TolC n=1 Tax=Sphingomonas kyeonggiensis TaxID=1268553 RepID=A0A7W6NVY8_9SPHN|nr:TolC family protein [Sphingomonas kyeonggiensis]MBB4097972.1 outer membrane protein TolC [Sphingomonas kyeonggiensis]
MHRRRFRLWLSAVYLGSSSFMVGTVRAQEVALSFDAADRRLRETSASLEAADHSVTAARETRASVKTLRRPVVNISAQYIEYQKSLSLDLTATKQAAATSAQDLIDGLPGSVPAPYQEVAAEIGNRLSQALPGLLAAIPDTLSYRYRDDVFRPTISVGMPLYTGGAVGAIQRGASAGVSLASAQSAQARDLARINLIRVYFGQLTAQSLEAAALETRDALAKLYSDAQRMEEAGLTPHSATLEAQVASDAAERVYQRASLAYRSAQDELARLLEVEAARPTTPLFVVSQALPPAASFLGGEDAVPQSRQADAARDIARAGVDLARSRFRPQAYAFGEYNLNRNGALPTEPDWVVGVGGRFTLFSNVGRGHALASAKAREMAAAANAREARKNAAIATLQAWDLVEAARRSFLLLDSGISAAKENLRSQQLSFREGEATIAAVLRAQSALEAAKSQRIAAAYEYDLALAGLLAASGQLDTFSDYLARADFRVAPETQP